VGERREVPARHEEDHQAAVPVVRPQRPGRAPRADDRGALGCASGCLFFKQMIQ